MIWKGDNPTNHFPNMMGENYKLGSGAQGLTSQSQQIMKDFLLDQGVGWVVRKTGGEKSWRRGTDAAKKEVGLVLHNHTNTQYLKARIPYFCWTAEVGEHPI